MKSGKLVTAQCGKIYADVIAGNDTVPSSLWRDAGMHSTECYRLFTSFFTKSCVQFAAGRAY